MTQRLFVDANIINDIYDDSRRFHQESHQCVEYCLQNNIRLVTSCDLVTTVYYITAKAKGKSDALTALEKVSNIFEIVPFGNALLEQAIHLMNKNARYSDLEDTIQYVLAMHSRCECILTNDKKFYSEALPKLSSSEFIQQRQH